MLQASNKKDNKSQATPTFCCGVMKSPLHTKGSEENIYTPLAPKAQLRVHAT